MRAAALLTRLPRPANTGDGTDAEKARQRRRRRRRRIHTGAIVELRLATAPLADPVQMQSAAQQTDLARVRRAGGPIDNASYTCACGYVFAAPVSTTVVCPHCGAGQAW